jgi:hypothetical protein
MEISTQKLKELLGESLAIEYKFDYYMNRPEVLEAIRNNEILKELEK